MPGFCLSAGTNGSGFGALTPQTVSLSLGSMKVKTPETPGVTIHLTGDQVKNFRVINAKINGAIGGRAKSARKAKASRRNGKLSLAAA
jgi:hypothetical protein